MTDKAISMNTVLLAEHCRVSHDSFISELIPIDLFYIKIRYLTQSAMEYTYYLQREKKFTGLNLFDSFNL